MNNKHLGINSAPPSTLGRGVVSGRVMYGPHLSICCYGSIPLGGKNLSISGFVLVPIISELMSFNLLCYPR